MITVWIFMMNLSRKLNCFVLVPLCVVADVCLSSKISLRKRRRKAFMLSFFSSEKTQNRAHIVHSNLFSLNFYSCSFLNHMFSLCPFKGTSDQVSMDTLCARNRVKLWFCEFGNGCVWLYDCIIYTGLLTRGRDPMMSHCCC